MLSKLIAGTMKWGRWGAKCDTQQYLSHIKTCLDAGITSFDHADIYGDYTTEAEFGEALKLQHSLRGQMQLITKCGIARPCTNRPQFAIKHYNTSREYIIAAAEQSLMNLCTDHIDILLIHRPDPLMNPDEMAEAFTYLQQTGKVLHFGVSNFTTSQTELLRSRFPIMANQIEVSVLKREPFLNGQLDQCIVQKLIPMAWSPLGGGNIFSSEDEAAKRVIAVAEILSQEYATQPDLVLLAWLLQHPSGILPVLGTSRAERLRKAPEALNIQLTRQQWFMLWRAAAGVEVP
jgi:predicted oxidoreductase